MKVLFLGVYRDGTGWGNAAIDSILALDAAGVDVVCRPIKLNSYKGSLPDRVVELENKSSQGCDTVIQHILPHMMDYNGRFERNIGMFDSETHSLGITSWATALNALDESWTICTDQAKAAKNSGVKVPISIVPHATDVLKYQETYEILDLEVPKDSFKFYFIGEMTRRKNLAALLKAFHLEFALTEPVELVIKTNINGMGYDETVKKMTEFCDEIKRGLKLYSHKDKYKSEVVICERLSEKDLMRVHASCDCFVMPSYGEAWCIPAFDAMAMGKTPICTDFGGPADFLRDGGGYLVPYHREPCFGMNETFFDLYTGYEDWASIDINALRVAMRYAYENSPEHQEHKEIGIERAYDYSHEAVGLIMKEILDNA